MALGGPLVASFLIDHAQIKPQEHLFLPIAVNGSTCSPYHNDGSQVVQSQGRTSIVYQTERVAISDCTWLLKSLTQYESQKVEDPA